MWGHYLRSYKVTKSYISCVSVTFYFLVNNVFVLFLPNFPTFLSIIDSIGMDLQPARLRGLFKKFVECLLNTAYGDVAMKRATCFRWHTRFKNGRLSVEDDERSGRPSTSADDHTLMKSTLWCDRIDV